MTPEPILSISPLGATLPFKADVPAGVDVDSIVAEVAADGVSAPASIEGDLLATVQRAQENGIDLGIVVVPDNPRHDSQLRDLATAVGAEDGGTVLVLSPGQVGSFSDTISRVTLEAGQDTTYTGNPVVAANNFVDTLVGPQAPWSLITVVLIVIVAAGAAVTAAAKVRRRNRVKAVDSSDDVDSSNDANAAPAPRT
ncbi:Rv1476 family membrane protein [Rhodococcus sp. P1Y]|uniref:Rv1476 family membrane protein n=1 Tax=Rhodococcus sp. P1Y TaxID=1302308 RepID=UPI001F32A731|nr:DUF6676 family protein [Rhodococcus sp. P1Y]